MNIPIQGQETSVISQKLARSRRRRSGDAIEARDLLLQMPGQDADAFLAVERPSAEISGASAEPAEVGLFQDIPAWIWRIFFLAWATIFLLFLIVFTTNASATFMVTISALTGLMMLGLPVTLASLTRKQNVTCDKIIETHTGPLSQRAAAAQIVLIPIGGVVGLAAFIILAM